MTSKNPNNHKNTGTYKKAEFETYALWKSLPSFLRGQPTAVLQKFGIVDEIALSLLDIRTQTQFAQKFGIKDLGTLSHWNKRIEEEGLVSFINQWARKLTPNVIAALYREVTKNGRAAEVRIWYELVESR